MAHSNRKIGQLLTGLQLGSSIAEQDDLLEKARIETSVFNDVLNDRVDLIPGTKGSGKTALYRIIVEFLKPLLVQQRKVVIAHGVHHHGDEVFHAFRDRFGSLTEDDFVSFWCVYLVSLANEHFIKAPEFRTRLKAVESEVRKFNDACFQARIPTFERRLGLKEVLDWALTVIQKWKPRMKYKMPENRGELELDLFGSPVPIAATSTSETPLPLYVRRIKEILEGILEKQNLHLWLMIDRLDEIFPRRSEIETKALRGLLRTLRIFESPQIRVKIFLRDDILDQIVSRKSGFTALTHLTARQAKKLEWSEEQILAMIVKRLFACARLAVFLKVEPKRINGSLRNQQETFYKVFPEAVFKGKGRTSTLRWIYRRCADGKGVVTPRDVIYLLTKAVQHQIDAARSNPAGTSEHIIGEVSLRYGYTEMSKWKRTAFLQAEFPHLWPLIENLVGGKTEYDSESARRLLGPDWEDGVDKLTSIGVLREERPRSDGARVFKVPFLYRVGLDLTQGRTRW